MPFLGSRLVCRTFIGLRLIICRERRAFIVWFSYIINNRLDEVLNKICLEPGIQLYREEEVTLIARITLQICKFIVASIQLLNLSYGQFNTLMVHITMETSFRCSSWEIILFKCMCVSFCIIVFLFLKYYSYYYYVLLYVRVTQDLIQLKKALLYVAINRHFKIRFKQPLVFTK